jgi:colanic acid biosynthesis glycosyl transferase WcaI
MNILILSQSYYPDTVSVAQHLTDFAEKLVVKGHTVTIITSRYGYDSNLKFDRREIHRGVRVCRIWQTKLGKRFFLLRAFDFFIFNISLFFNCFFVIRERVDVVLSTTSPPLSAVVGLIVSRIKQSRFLFWVMDLQPELAIASGVISDNSVTSKFFTFVGDYLIKSADQIVSLDKFMSAHLIERGAKKEKIREVPVWPVMQGQYSGVRDENPFRISCDYEKRIVVMFSGNHALVHPMSTLLLAAKKLRHQKDILFAFVGGGVRKQDVSEFKLKFELQNISQHPFQPRSSFHISIAAADIQVVIMGDGQVGYTHPNKIYGAMFLAKPILYIGPKGSHVTEILDKIAGNIIVEHGEVNLLVDKIKGFSELTLEQIKSIGDANHNYAKHHFSPDLLLNKMIEVIEEHRLDM